MSWKVIEWEPTRREGRIEGEHLGPFAFDANHTDVTDYRIGESVKVDFERGEELIIRHVRPSRPRFSGEAPDGIRAPELESSLRRAANRALKVIPAELLRVRSWRDDELIVDVLDGTPYDTTLGQVIFSGVWYAEVAPEITADTIELSMQRERDYLLSRQPDPQYDADAFASVVTVTITEEETFYFVVSSEVRFRRAVE